MTHVFSIPMRTRFRGISVREGVLVRGDAGWGEWSPFLEYDAATSRPCVAGFVVTGFDRVSIVFCSAGERAISQLRSRWACVRGAGNSSWMAALSSAPIMTAKPAKKANSRKAIGVDSAP